MKKSAALILNRNLPALADELGDWILENNRDLVDLYIIENGSDADKYSKYANIIFTESNGAAAGVNQALLQLLEQPYEYFWINYNDARYRQSDFFRMALDAMEKNPRIGVVTGYWPGNVRMFGNLQELSLVSFFDSLGFVVSRKALLACQKYSRMNLTPLWDSSNYTLHYNILGTGLAVYSAGIGMVTNQNYEIYELEATARTQSTQARGVSDTTWKHDIGPKVTREWQQRVWPELRGNMKEVREQVIAKIQIKMVQQFPEAFSWSQRLFSYMRQVLPF